MENTWISTKVSHRPSRGHRPPRPQQQRLSLPAPDGMQIRIFTEPEIDSTEEQKAFLTTLGHEGSRKEVRPTQPAWPAGRSPTLAPLPHCS